MKISFKLEYNNYLIIFLVLIVLVFINVISLRHFYRKDLTQDQQYVISEVSKKTVAGLNDRLGVKVFFSKKLPPNLMPLSLYVRDILSEYSAYSKGKLTIEYLDPAKNTDLKQEVKSLGIPEVRMNVLEKDKWQVQNGYLGIALFYADKHEILPVVKDTQNFEYDFTSALKRVIADDTKTLGFLSGHKEHTIAQYVPEEEKKRQDYKTLSRELLKNYEIKNIQTSSGNKIEGIDTLIVAGPQETLSQRDLFEIDQFIMNGGHVVFMVDQMSLSDGLTGRPLDSGLDKMLAHYGVLLGKDLVLDVINQTVPFSNGMMQFFIPYPFWPKLTASNFSKVNPIVSKLESVSIPWGSSVSKESSLPHNGLTVDILIKTSPKGWVQNNFNVDPNQKFKISESDRHQVGEMALVSGIFKSYFSDKKVPLSYGKGEDGVPVEIKGSAKDRTIKQTADQAGQLVVFGDSDFVSDSTIKNFPSNLSLMLNVVDYLTLDTDLINIRSKKITDRPLNELSEGVKNTIKAIGVLLGPIVIVFYGIFRMMLKKRKNSLSGR